MAKNDFSSEVAENYEQKCLCVLVLDVSGSMGGSPIQELNNGLQDFYNEISNVSSVRKYPNNHVIYDLTGQKVIFDHYLKPGIYIKNGKKMVINHQ